MTSACNKYLDVKPVGKVIPTTASDFRALMTSAYQTFPAHKSLLALRTDELLLDPNSTDIASIRDIYLWRDGNPDPKTREMPYVSFYTAIFYSNSIIADAQVKAGNTPEVRQIIGEAYVMRAYATFELLNLYANVYNAGSAATDKGVPESVKIDLEQTFPRVSQEQNYKQIFDDIAQAQQYLNEASFKQEFAYRFTTRALPALKARIYLYRGEWQQALDAAVEGLAINNDLEDLNSSSLLPSDYKSKEMNVALENCGNPVVSTSTFISDELKAKYDENGDMRYKKYFSLNFDGSLVSAKGSSSARQVSFRNGELYLIKAEAEAHLGKTTDAIASVLSLDAKRLTPAYLAVYRSKLESLTGDALLQEIIQERARELALEGLRWYDLRRTSQPELNHEFQGMTGKIAKNDTRYTIVFPLSARTNNPDLK